jgi:RNA polymerase sigma-70 factor (ECF subfamily)
MLESGDLKQVHRVCLLLRYVHGMTRAEIAAQTGLTEMQVKGHLQYGLTLLRKAYGVAER